MTDLAKCKKQILNSLFKVCLDSRLVKHGEYFVAIKGENNDGHKYIKDVLSKGSSGVLEDFELFDLARFKLSHIKPLIIGVTGSTGKSSVTSLITQMLETKYSVCKGSLNTKLGLSVDTINNMPLNCEVFIAEMGMDDLGQIKEMTDMFKPHIAVITTINQTHAEKLGNIENIVKAKAEILENMEHDDVAILNKDNRYTRKIRRKFKGKVLWFGENPSAHYNLNSLDMSGFRLLGKLNKLNLLASIAVCEEAGMRENEIANVIPKLTALKGRLNIIEGINDNVLIDDTYNSSPASSNFALDVLADFKGKRKRKIAILGDMLELGQFQKRYHIKLGEYVLKKKIDVLVTVGKLIEFTNKAVQGHKIKTYHISSSDMFDSEVIPKLEIKKGDVILIKGSQGIRMEKITKVLMKRPKDAEKLLVRQDIGWK